MLQPFVKNGRSTLKVWSFIVKNFPVVTNAEKNKATPESAASDVGAPLDKVLEALEKTK